MGMICNLLRVTEKTLGLYSSGNASLSETLEKENDLAIVDIDKSWDGLCYILTGYPGTEQDKAEPPLKWILFGNKLSGEDLGYGPLMFVSVEQATAVNEAIKDISAADFKTLFLRSGLVGNNAIYPHVNWADANQALSYYQDYFESLQEVYALAAQESEAVITFIRKEK